MTWPTWSEVAEVLQALAAVLWPAAIIFAILRFYKDVRALIGGLKLTKGKLFGQEFELTQLDKLEKETRTLQTSDAVSFSPEPAQQQYMSVVRKVFGEAATSPKAALMLLQAEIERELRTTLEKKGFKGVNEERIPYLRAMEIFLDKEEVPPEFGRWLKEFREVRNQIIHGRDTSNEDALRAIDIGARILATLDRIEKNPRITPGTGEIRTSSP